MWKAIYKKMGVTLGEGGLPTEKQRKKIGKIYFK